MKGEEEMNLHYSIKRNELTEKAFSRAERVIDSGKRYVIPPKMIKLIAYVIQNGLGGAEQ